MQTSTLNDGLRDTYERIYESLGAMRETFHRSGRLDDSNAKLDEVAKLFACYVASKSKPGVQFPESSDPQLITRLQDAFAEVAYLPEYTQPDGKSVFGTQPAIALREGDEELASQIVGVVRQSIDYAYEMRTAGRPFDLLNEAFGHFIRDNFRGNVEDAQYLTPPEVVEFMAQLLLEDLAREDPASHDTSHEWVFMDPTCGVGSFLGAIYDVSGRVPQIPRERIQLIAQDKVERMVRLCTVNFQLFGVAGYSVTLGDSSSQSSPLMNWFGKVDAILTNPPFGATFKGREIQEAAPELAELAGPEGSVDSELLFVEQNLKFLRPNGRLLIVVPDGVVSARGIAARLRHQLAGRVTIRAVVELPATTFAQAGTRTKTAVLYLQKCEPTPASQVFMGVVEDLGFEVSSRKGVQVKKAAGENELPTVLRAYLRNDSTKPSSGTVVLSESPSCVLVPHSEVLRTSWTPRHFSAKRFSAIAQVANSRAVEMVPLGDLVTFDVGSRPSRASSTSSPAACISVKHVLGEGFLDVHAALNYRPVTPGTIVTPGVLLLSRINPRIPRVCIVPDLGRLTTCSTEFEVMETHPGSVLSNAALAFLLQAQVVQSQIESLTSGTSSSHNRIRTSELAEVLVPIPIEGSQLAHELREQTRKYTKALESMAHAALALSELSDARATTFASHA